MGGLGESSKWTDFATWNVSPAGWKLKSEENKDFFNFLIEYKDTIGEPIWKGKSVRDVFHTKPSLSRPTEKKTFVYLVNGLHILIIRYEEKDGGILSYILSKNPIYSIRSIFKKKKDGGYDRYQYSFNESDDSNSFVKTMGVTVSGTILREASKHFFMEYQTIDWKGTEPLQKDDINDDMNSNSQRLFGGFKNCELKDPKDTSCWLQKVRSKLKEISKPIGHHKRIILNYSDKFLETPLYFDAKQDRLLEVDDATLAQLKEYLKTLRDMQILGAVNEKLDESKDNRKQITVEAVSKFLASVSLN